MRIVPLCGIFIFNEDNHILCVREQHEFDGQDHWIIPGGGIDDGETPEQAAIREVKEETGLDVSGPSRLLYEITIPKQDVILKAYGLQFMAYSGVLSPMDPDIKEAAFVPLDFLRTELPGHQNPKRTDPILKILDDLTAQRALEFFQWEL